MAQSLSFSEVGVAAPALEPYEVLTTIWRGKTADFFLALAPAKEGKTNKVVIKRLRPDLVDDEDFRATFLHQGRIAARLRHPNVVETIEVRRDGDETFVIMEFLDGQLLSHVRRRPQAVTSVPLSIHLRVLANVLGGLHYLHQSREDEAPDGIVHGDVRPDNVLVTYDGEVKLLLAGIDNAEATTGIIKEKLSYMAPERARGEAVDRRSDIFSVGIMLWEAITGLRFWQDWPEVAIFRRLCSETLPLHPQWVPIAARDLFAIAERALAVSPGDRFGSAAEMQEALDAVLARPGNDASRATIRAYMEMTFAKESGGGEQDDVEDPTIVRSSAPSSLAPVSTANTSPIETRPSAPRERRRQRLYAVLGTTALASGVWIVGHLLARGADAGSQSVLTTVQTACSPGVVSQAASNGPASSETSAAVSADAGGWTAAACASVLQTAPSTLQIRSEPPKMPRPRRTVRVEDPWGI